MVFPSPKRRWSQPPGGKQAGQEQFGRRPPYYSRAEYGLPSPDFPPLLASTRSGNLSNRERRYFYDAGGDGRKVWPGGQNSAFAREGSPASGSHSAPVVFVFEIPRCCPHPERMILAARAETPRLEQSNLDHPGLDPPDLGNKARGLRPESSFNPMRLDF